MRGTFRPHLRLSPPVSPRLHLKQFLIDSVLYVSSKKLENVPTEHSVAVYLFVFVVLGFGF